MSKSLVHAAVDDESDEEAAQQLGPLHVEPSCHICKPPDPKSLSHACNHFVMFNGPLLHGPPLPPASAKDNGLIHPIAIAIIQCAGQVHWFQETKTPTCYVESCRFPLMGALMKVGRGSHSQSAALGRDMVCSTAITHSVCPAYIGIGKPMSDT